ncbi:MAG TPA: LamG domain-containing protein [Tepidisphaeraceae bacterium]
MNSPISRHLLVAAALAILLGATSARAGLIHRYSFSDKGTTAKDSVGNVDAKLKGDGAKLEDGKLVIKNDEGVNSADEKLSYCEFASPILPKASGADASASVVVWFSAKEPAPYARIFNFSDAEAGEGRAFLYFTARNADDKARIGITATDAGAKTFQDLDRLDDGATHMVAVVVDGATKKLHVYVDGKEPNPAEDLGDNTLDKVRPVSNWIGRSSFDNDPGLTATIDELRVYDNALTAEQVAAAHKAGADTLPADKK